MNNYPSSTQGGKITASRQPKSNSETYDKRSQKPEIELFFKIPQLHHPIDKFKSQ